MKIRKLVSVALLAILTLGNTIYANDITSKFTLNSTTYVVDGVTKTMDASPKMIDGRVYLPLRATTQALGVPDENVKWDNRTETVTITDGPKIIKLTNNAIYITVDGKPISMDGKATSINGRIYLPLSQVAKAFDGVSVRWMQQTKSVEITRANGAANSSIDKSILENAGFTLASINGLVYYEMPEANYSDKLIYADFAYKIDDEVRYRLVGSWFHIEQKQVYNSEPDYKQNNSRAAVETNLMRLTASYALKDYTIIENETTYVAEWKHSTYDSKVAYIFCKNSSAVFYLRTCGMDEFRCWNDNIWNAFIHNIQYQQ